MTPNEVQKGIDALRICHDLIVFNPMTGKSIDPIYLNEDNRDLYYGIETVLKYIYQLESIVGTLKYTLSGVMHSVDKWLDVPPYDVEKDQTGTVAVSRSVEAREVALRAIEQLEAERDAAVSNIRKGCSSCKHDVKEVSEEPCNSCRRNNAGGSKNPGSGAVYRRRINYDLARLSQTPLYR